MEDFISLCYEKMIRKNIQQPLGFMRFNAVADILLILYLVCELCTESQMVHSTQLFQICFEHVQASCVYISWGAEWAAVSGPVGFLKWFMTPQSLHVFCHHLKAKIISNNTFFFFIFLCFQLRYHSTVTYCSCFSFTLYWNKSKPCGYNIKLYA